MDDSVAESCARCGVEVDPGGRYCWSCGAPLDGEARSLHDSANDPTDARLGWNVLGYRVEKRIGQGGMATVYRARHAVTGQVVAVKFLDPALARNPDLRRRFEREARIQARLRHPNILPLQNYTIVQGEPVLVLKYFEGMSLEDVLNRRGSLPFDDVRHIFGQVLDALECAHLASVVHRDIKPSNILVQADGLVQITDFGVAKLAGGSKLTRTGTSVGTCYYMSPEQVLGKKGLDHRSDIYSVGATLFETLTGSPPFEVAAGCSASEGEFLVKKAHVESPPPDPRRLNGDIPPLLAQVVVKALAKDPAHRFQSCRDFKRALEAALDAPAEAPEAPENPSGSDGCSPIRRQADQVRHRVESAFKDLTWATQRRGTWAREEGGTLDPPLSEPSPKGPAAGQEAGKRSRVVPADPAGTPVPVLERLRAGWGRRAGAYLADVFVLAILGIWLGFISPDFAEGAGALLLFAGIWLLYDWAAVHTNGRTLGHWLFGLRVTGRTGGRPTAGQAFVRSFIKVIFAGSLGGTLLDAVVGITSTTKRCIHDRMSGTYVVLGKELRRHLEP